MLLAQEHLRRAFPRGANRVYVPTYLSYLTLYESSLALRHDMACSICPMQVLITSNTTPQRIEVLGMRNPRTGLALLCNIGRSVRKVSCVGSGMGISD